MREGKIIVRAGGTEASTSRGPKSMRLKILVVTAMYPHAGNQGSGAFVMQQVEQLRAMEHEVDVLHFQGYRSKIEYLKAAFEVRKRTRGAKYDVVHAHYGVTGVAAVFRSHTPLVVTLHGSDALLGRIEPAISRWVCRRADATIAVSGKIAARIPGEIIPCGVDLNTFEPKDRARARKRLGLSGRKRYVLFPFSPARTVKRFDLASGAVNRLAADGLDVELLTVSKVPNTEMPWYYSAADAMILCSDSEGSPTAVKEALACNLPVISTDVGDVAEIVQGIAGVQICRQTSEALAEGLKKVLAPPAGFVFESRPAMRRYSQERIIQAIVQVYRRAIEQRRRMLTTGGVCAVGAGTEAGSARPPRNG
ncbi:MAG: glycosyltransferase family 4 protein [Verrucomicrobia bacterium]|nr:MAG: glycosyltransferase family 4 protein [Verrucomicrobiota bacterium]